MAAEAWGPGRVVDSRVADSKGVGRLKKAGRVGRLKVVSPLAVVSLVAVVFHWLVSQSS